VPPLSPSPTAAPQAGGYAYVASLVISPEVPPTYYLLIGDGIYRSTDRGATWLAVPPPDLPAGAALYSLALDYRAPETLYATSSAGIYVRRDGTWALVNTLPARCLAVDLQESHILWAGVFYSTEYNSLVLRSDDAGRTWSAAGAGLPGDRQNWVAHILIDPANPETMYANVRSTGRHGWPEGWLYRGGHAGSWEPLPLPTPIDPLACMVNGLALDPQEHRLWVGCDAYYYNENRLALARSANYDETNSRDVVWESLANLAEPGEGIYYGYVRALAADAGEVPSRIFVALSAGPDGVGAALPQDVLFTRDGSTTWEVLPLPAIP